MWVAQNEEPFDGLRTDATSSFVARDAFTCVTLLHHGCTGPTQGE